MKPASLGRGATLRGGRHDQRLDRVDAERLDDGPEFGLAHGVAAWQSRGMTRSPLTSRLAFVMAGLALFVSLGGDSLAQRAIASLKKDSVKSRQIKNGAIFRVDLSKPLRSKLGVPGPRGPQGPKGPQGPEGPPGEQVDLADGSVTTAKLAENAVKGAQVADGSLGDADLAANSVTAAEIVTSAVGQPEIADNAVGASEMADNAIDANEVANGSLKAADVGKGSGTVTLDFPLIAVDECAELTFDAGVNTAGEAVLVTPGGSFPDDFPVTAAVVGGGNGVIVTACNEFVAAGDPLPVKFAYVVFDV